MRAVEPIDSGMATNPVDGIRVAWEAFGCDGPTVLLLPTWAIVHSRQWKFQVAGLARRFRVITFDPRGNGRSDRPLEGAAHGMDRLSGDAIAVLDACGQARAIVVGFSLGGVTALTVATDWPQRVDGLVLIAPALPASTRLPAGRVPIDTEVEHPEGWQLYTKSAWRREYERFVCFFFTELLPEPHSTKPWDDAVAWALETDGEVLCATADGPTWRSSPELTLDRFARVRCPTLLIHGDDDRIVPVEASRSAFEAIETAQMVTMEGSGHLPHIRDPIAVNRLIEGFVDEVHPQPRPSGGSRSRSQVWARGLERRRKVLYVSSPIGLGHARRDIAIASELADLVPGLEIDWLAQPPVTSVLEAEGHRVHPASAQLASESAHVTERACEHDLHVFQALREMDEIMVANFHIFQDVVEADHYDLVVADEAWDIDHFWFENPELKRTPLVWMTDFVGYLPMPSGGEREALVAADYNAEMIEHVARYPAMRDRAIFVGHPDDIVPATFGPDLPAIRAWTEANFDFAGYVTGFDPANLGDRDELRAELGYRDGEVVCVVAVGGSGVGGAMLRQAVEAFDDAAATIDGLRMIAVCGPRIDPSGFASRDGLEVVGYVPKLHRHLAACDVAIVQGGLTTTMELVASGTPFLYAPLANHFEQQFHVRHRLDRYRAGHCIDLATITPDAIAEALGRELARTCDYLPVETDGARRAATRIAELLVSSR